jgi:hypothetical protein
MRLYGAYTWRWAKSSIVWYMTISYARIKVV